MKIYIGGIGTKSREEFLENMLAEKDKYSKQYLLVPENLSYNYENSILLNGSNMSVDVITFNRLPYILFKNSKYRNITYIDEVLRDAYIKKAISNLDIVLLKKDKNISEISKLISRLKSQGIQIQDLKNKIENEEITGILKLKMEELVAIIEEYDRILDERKDKSEELSILCSEIFESDFFNNSKLYISGFASFTPMQFEVITNIILKSKDVDVEITIPDIQTENILFEDPKKTLSNLVRVMSNKGDVELKKYTEDVFHKGEIRRLNDVILYGKTNSDYKNNDEQEEKDEKEKGNSNIHIIGYDNKSSEIQETARCIYNDIKNGYNISDIQIVSNEYNSYYNYIEREFAKYGIPIYMMEEKSIITSTLVSYILDLVSSVLGDAKAIIALAKYGYFKEFGITSNDIYMLEKYLYKWNIFDLSRNAEFRFDKNKPEFERIERTKNILLFVLVFFAKSILKEDSNRKDTSIVIGDEEAEKISDLGEDIVIDDILEQLGYSLLDMPKLFKSYSEKLKKIEISAKDITEAIVIHLRKYGIYKKIYNEILKMDDVSKLYEYKNGINILNDVFDKIYQIGDIKIFDYTNYLAEILSEKKQQDQKKSGALSICNVMNAERGKKITYIIGMQDGIFPLEKEITGIITERENNTLRSLDINIYNTIYEDQARNYNEIYNVVMSASDSIIMSYAKRDDILDKELTKSYFIPEILKIMDNNDIRYDFKEDNLKDDNYIFKIVSEVVTNNILENSSDILGQDFSNIIFKVLEKLPNIKKAMFDLSIYLSKKIGEYAKIVYEKKENIAKIVRLAEIYYNEKEKEIENEDENKNKNKNSKDELEEDTEYEKRTLEKDILYDDISKTLFCEIVLGDDSDSKSKSAEDVISYYGNLAKIYDVLNDSIIYHMDLSKVYDVKQSGNSPNNLPSDILKMLYRNELNMTVSRLEKYASCPFAYHIRYGLDVSKDNTSKLESVDTGSFMHDVLKEVFDSVITGDLNIYDKLEKRDLSYLKLRALEDGSLNAEIESYENDIYNTLSVAISKILKKPEYEKFLSDEKYNRIMDNLERELFDTCIQVAETLRLSDYKIFGNEIEITKEGNSEIPDDISDITKRYNPIEIHFSLDGKDQKLVIYGKIDRADISGDNIRIVDYKTSRNDIYPEKVRAGLQLQLIVYANILEELIKKENKGLLYQQITRTDKNLALVSNHDMIKEANSNRYQKMQGLVVADSMEDILQMDNTILEIEDNKSRILPVTLKKDGTPSSNSKVITEDSYNNLKKDAMDEVIKISKNILNGNVKIYPSNYYVTARNQEKACRFCDYNSICKFQKGNKYRIINRDKK